MNFLVLIMFNMNLIQRSFVFLSHRSQLPARATRLLTRRLQSNAGSDSPRSLDSVSGRTPVIKGSFNQYNRCDSNTNSADDLSLIDKSIRNAMLHDVAHCKKQLICLRRILQEVSVCSITIISKIYVFNLTLFIFFFLIFMFSYYSVCFKTYETMLA